MEAWEGDLLERAEVAEFLQNLLESDDTIKVINIDSPWGTGKTFFLENWKAQLEENRGVVYFNAWKKDYTGDPFVSLVAALKDQLTNQRGVDVELEKSLEGFVDKASKAIAATTPIMLKFAAKGFAKKLIGFEVDEADAALKSVTDDVAEAAIKSLIQDSEKEQQVVEDFTEALETLVVEVAEFKSEDEGAPVYILIDELDRCRPTYAIELLERVKHFFNVPGCKFIIATDTAQLAHSVKAVYGSGFNSVDYLKRFFDVEFSLDNKDMRLWIKTHFNIEYQRTPYCMDIAKVIPKDFRSYSLHGQQEIIYPSGNAVINKKDSVELSQEQLIFLALCETFKISLRGMEKIKRHYNAAMANINDKNVHSFILMYLIFLKYVDNEIFVVFFDASFGSDSISELLKERFSERCLYFGVSERSVHELALFYREVSLMSNKALQRSFDSDDESAPYLNKVKMDAYKDGSYFRYEKVVNLAGSIG